MLTEKASLTMPEEPFFVEIGVGVPSNAVHRALEIVCRHTSECRVVLDGAGLENNPLLGVLEKAGVRKLCARLPLKRGPDQLGPWETIRYQSLLGRSETAYHFQNSCLALKDRFEIFPEVTLSAGEMDGLFPTLASFSEQGTAWAALNPNGLSMAEGEKAIREALTMLRLKRHTNTSIYFLPWRRDASRWNTRTRNWFSGPTEVHIDPANTCTHNCVFCGLYSEKGLELRKGSGGGRLSKDVIKYMSQRLDSALAMKFIASLSDVVEEVQFGGAGDPYTHPEIDQFVDAVRRRGFPVRVLTNFAYMTRQRIEALHALSRGEHGRTLHFVINISAATPQTYARIRPNQPPRTFDHVTAMIRYSRELARRDGVAGPHLTLMSVTNRHNFREMAGLVRLGKELDVHDIWIKPVEVHDDAHLDVLPRDDEKERYAECAREAMHEADRLGMALYDRHVMEMIGGKVG